MPVGGPVCRRCGFNDSHHRRCFDPTWEGPAKIQMILAPVGDATATLPPDLAEQVRAVVGLLRDLGGGDIMGFDYVVALATRRGLPQLIADIHAIPDAYDPIALGC